MRGAGLIADTAIISKLIRVRYPGHFAVGDRSVVDDFCYFSTKVRIGSFSHIANGCSVAGGLRYAFSLGDYSSLSSGVKAWCQSDDFNRSLVFLPPEGFEDIKESSIGGDIVIGSFTGIGANTVVMPSNVIPDGTTIGALSFVPANFRFEPWSVYAGIPVRRLRSRDREAVLRQVRRLEERLQTASSARRERYR